MLIAEFADQSEASFSDEANQSLDDVEEEDDVWAPLSPSDQAVVDLVMDEFWIIFNQQWGNGISQRAGVSTTGSGAARGLVWDLNTGFPQRSALKRKRQDEEDDLNERAGKRCPPPEKGSIPGQELDDGTRFACPFRKNNPSKYSIYSHRACALSHWGTIARLKYAHHSILLYQTP
jgi:hypothetical protein